MKEKWEKAIKKYGVYIALAALAAAIIVSLLVWWNYYNRMGRSGLEEFAGAREYERHYVMITEDTDSSMWEKIYESAKNEGAAQDAWVEMLGSWFNDEYTALDYMKIAISAKVDGIIVKPDGTQKMKAAINEAEAAGIPVVTVLEDETDSARKSFVGINSYELGVTYGNQVLQCVDENTETVLVLLNGKDAGKDLVYKQLKATVQEGIADGRQIAVRAMTITSGNEFDAEEVIRDIFIEESERPDILVCMNETDSVRAYQAMIDYNCVGNVELIGYYQSGTMLGAIQKGIVPVAISPDSDQMGRYSVEALEEYYRMGYVSNYYSVDLNIVTSTNVNRFLEE